MTLNITFTCFNYSYLFLSLIPPLIISILYNCIITTYYISLWFLLLSTCLCWVLLPWFFSYSCVFLLIYQSIFETPDNTTRLLCSTKTHTQLQPSAKEWSPETTVWWDLDWPYQNKSPGISHGFGAVTVNTVMESQLNAFVLYVGVNHDTH